MRPKCPKCKKGHVNEIGIASKTHPRIVMCLCGWSRRVSRAAIIRLATEKRGALKEAYSLGYSHGHEAVMRDRIRDAMEPKKRETCKWTEQRGHVAHDAFGTRGRPWMHYVTKCDKTFHDRTKYCGGCGKPVEVVND